MEKSKLKQLIKECIRECIKESLRHNMKESIWRNSDGKRAPSYVSRSAWDYHYPKGLGKGDSQPSVSVFSDKPKRRPIKSVDLMAIVHDAKQGSSVKTSDILNDDDVRLALMDYRLGKIHWDDLENVIKNTVQKFIVQESRQDKPSSDRVERRAARRKAEKDVGYKTPIGGAIPSKKEKTKDPKRQRKQKDWK